MGKASRWPGAGRGAGVREPAGYISINTTSLYARVVIEDEEEAGDLFSFAAA